GRSRLRKGTGSNTMLIRSACMLLLLLTTASGQDAQFSYDLNFGPFPKHAFHTSQGAIHITFHGLPLNGADWAMAVNPGKDSQISVTRALVENVPFVSKNGTTPPFTSSMKTIVDMKEWKNVRVSDGVIEINALDALQDYALAINLTVP